MMNLDSKKLDNWSLECIHKRASMSLIAALSGLRSHLSHLTHVCRWMPIASAICFWLRPSRSRASLGFRLGIYYLCVWIFAQAIHSSKGGCVCKSIIIATVCVFCFCFAGVIVITDNRCNMFVCFQAVNVKFHFFLLFGLMRRCC